jgi:hypothetical protein
VGRKTIPRLRHIILLVYHHSCLRQWRNWWTGISGRRFWGYVPHTDTNLPTYQGKTNETALHHVITHIQEAVENREVTLGVFLHIKEAFDNTSCDIIERLSNGMGTVK